MKRVRLVVMVVVVGVAVTVAACGGEEKPDQVGVFTNVLLSTECGILGLRTPDGHQWKATPPLRDEQNGGTPPGWRVPTEYGRMIVFSDGSGEFHGESSGQVAWFERLPRGAPAAFECL